MQKMTQIQAIVETLRLLGGVATLTQINNHIFEIKDCEWKGKTPFATSDVICSARQNFSIR